MSVVCRLCGLIALFVIYAQHPAVRTVNPCTETALDQVLADVQPGDTVNFGCSGTLVTTGGKRISTGITLDGSGQSVTISNDGTIPVFQIDIGITVTINHLAFAHNHATGTIENRGTLIVQDVHFASADRGLYNGKGARLRVSGSSFTGNDVGIVNLGEATVTTSTFVDNRRDGIYNRGTLTVVGCTLAGNRHGIDNDHGPLVVANSTFADNHVSGGSGAGIANSGPLTVINSTFARNRASAGGALFNHEGGTITLRNTIVSGSAEGNCAGPIVDGGANLQYPGVTCGKRIPTVDPGLLPLADNGGPTLTIALANDSAAIGAGDAAVCAAPPVNGLDQRGMPRLGNHPTRCDIGAVETESIPNAYWFKQGND